MTGTNFDRRVNLVARCAREILREVLPAAIRDSPAAAARVAGLLDDVERLIADSAEPGGPGAAAAGSLGVHPIPPPGL